MQKFLFVLLAALSPLIVSAQIYERIKTADGCEYNGYIKEQIPGKSVVIYSVRTHLRVSKSSISDRREEYRLLRDFDEETQSYLAEKGNLEADNIALVSLKSGGVWYDNVYVTDESGYNLAFISFEKKSYELPWGKIESKESLISKDDGLLDVVTLRNGERYVGRIKSQHLGKTVEMETEEGKNIVASNDDIVSISIQPRRTDTPIRCQTPLLDIVEKNDGTECRGLIFSKIYDSKNPYVQFLNNDAESLDEKYVIQTTEIAKYIKEVNVEFDSDFDYHPYGENVREKEENHTEEELQILINGEQAPLCDFTKKGKKGKKYKSEYIPYYKVSSHFEIVSTKKVDLCVYKQRRPIHECGEGKFSFNPNSNPIPCLEWEECPDGKYKCECVLPEEGEYVIVTSDHSKGIAVQW